MYKTCFYFPPHSFSPSVLLVYFCYQKDIINIRLFTVIIFYSQYLFLPSALQLGLRSSSCFLTVFRCLWRYYHLLAGLVSDQVYLPKLCCGAKYIHFRYIQEVKGQIKKRSRKRLETRDNKGFQSYRVEEIIFRTNLVGRLNPDLPTKRRKREEVGLKGNYEDCFRCYDLDNNIPQAHLWFWLQLWWTISVQAICILLQVSAECLCFSAS